MPKRLCECAIAGLPEEHSATRVSPTYSTRLHRARKRRHTRLSANWPRRAPARAPVRQDTPELYHAGIGRVRTADSCSAVRASGCHRGCHVGCCLRPSVSRKRGRVSESCECQTSTEQAVGAVGAGWWGGGRKGTEIAREIPYWPLLDNVVSQGVC